MKKLTLYFTLLSIAMLATGGSARAQLLYGMTLQGGVYDSGTIFNFNISTGIMTKVFDFNTAIGFYPNGSLYEASNGYLYGMTSAVGTPNEGTLFRYDFTTNTLTTLVNFTGPNGANPNGSVIQAADSNLYGLTYTGGTHDSGTLFRYNISNKTLTTLINFTKNIGTNPNGTLIQAIDGGLYGMTLNGGISDSGTIFRYDIGTGIITTLVSFDWTKGCNPYGSLIQAYDSNLYGITSIGGTYKLGTIFKCSTSGSYSLLAYFNDTNGAYSYCSLMQATDSNFYGLATTGGTKAAGTIFKCTTKGIINVLVNFNNNNGINPNGSLMQASDGNLYGTALLGGADGDGTVFKCTTAGVFNYLNFKDTNGKYPGYGTLIQVKNIITSNNNISKSDLLNIFPNPANDKLTVELPQGCTISELAIYNVVGEKLYSTETGFNNNRYSLDVSSLIPGIYFLEVITNYGKEEAKFVKD